MSPDEADTNRIIMAINKLIQSCTSTSKPKLWKPVPFDGSNPKKLHTFIFQCKLNFRDGKISSILKEKKVNHTLSPSIALDCFAPALLVLHNPIWLLDFNIFLMELENNLKSFDPEGKVEAELKALCMHENHQAMKYFIKFQQLASQVQWGDAAL